MMNYNLIELIAKYSNERTKLNIKLLSKYLYNHMTVDIDVVKLEIYLNNLEDTKCTKEKMENKIKELKNKIKETKESIYNSEKYKRKRLDIFHSLLNKYHIEDLSFDSIISCDIYTGLLPYRELKILIKFQNLEIDSLIIFMQNSLQYTFLDLEGYIGIW